MKKNLSIFLMAVLCAFLSKTANSQTNCNGFTTNTDWRNYAPPGGVVPVPPIQNINDFNWSTNFFTIYKDIGGVVTATQLQSPFWENTSGLATEPNIDHFRNKFFNNGFYTNPTQAIESVDIWPEDGWELLYKDFGTPTTAYSDNPSFALYNRFTGILRIFYYVEQLGNTASSTARIAIQPSQGVSDRNNALLSFTNTEINALDNFERHLSHALNYAQALSDFWIFTEIPLAFDPCVCRYPTDSKMEFKFEIIKNASIVLEGNASGFSNPTIYNNGVYTPTKSNIVSSQKTKKGGSDLLKDANGFYKSLSKFKDNVNTMIGYQNSKKGDNTQALNEMSVLFDAWKVTAKAIPKLGAAIGIIDFLVTGGKAKNTETKEPTPVGYTTELDLELTGSIVEDINLSTVALRTPGANSTGSPNPIYNDPLGVFNLLESPTVEYAEYSSTNQSAVINRFLIGPGATVAYNTIGSNTSSAFNNIKIREYQLVQSATYNRLINYIINPSSELTATKIKAALLFKFSNLPDVIDTNNYINYFAGPVEFGITNPERAGFGFVHRLRMLGYEIESWPEGSAKIKDITFRTHYADLACLEEEANFYCWDNTDASVDYVPETWLKLDVQLQRNDAYAVANPTETQDVMMILKYKTKNSQNTSVQNLKYTANMLVGGVTDPDVPQNRRGYEILPNGDFQPNSASWNMDSRFPWNGHWGYIRQHTMTQGPWNYPTNKKYGTLIVDASNSQYFLNPTPITTINAYNLYVHPSITFFSHHVINVGNQVYAALNWSTINSNINWQQNTQVLYVAGPGQPVDYFGSTFSPVESPDPATVALLLSVVDLNDPFTTLDVSEMFPFINTFVTRISPDGSILLTGTNVPGTIYVHGFKFCADPVQNFQATQSDVTSFCTGNDYATLSQAKSEDFSEDKNTTINDELTKEQLKVYPNPNNGIFTSSFNINGTKNISLSITDLSGKVIETIINNQSYTTGYYKQNILLDNISAGIYICNLTIGENVLREKIVVIK